MTPLILEPADVPATGKATMPKPSADGFPKRRVTTEARMKQSGERLIGRLTELGFSQYESRAYVGLLRSESVTGYALANATGIPQSKVYETLRRLAERGAAVKVTDEPARYAALPPERLLEELESHFRGRLEAAQAESEQLSRSGHGEWHEPLVRMGDYRDICTRAEAMIAGARTKLYVTGWADHLRGLKPALETAGDRGLELIVLHFGKLALRIDKGGVYRHASTEGALYRRHRSRQLAVVADSDAALWALAPDGDDWGALYSEDSRVVMLVKGSIRHDIYVQRIYERLPHEMHAIFGPGLEYLPDLSNAVGLDRPAAAPEREEAGRVAS